MRTIPLLLTAAASLALAGGAAQAQQSWGPKHTTFWNSDATGRYAPNQFMPGLEAQTQFNAPQAKTGTQAGQAPVRPGIRSTEPPSHARGMYRGRPRAMPTQAQQNGPGMRQRPGAQPPSDVRPSAPPSGRPMQYRQPGQVPK